MRYASVCDGIGAVHVAWQPLGWGCAWTSEIDAFPAAVVEQRWGFPNRGDMTRFRDWGDLDVDLLVGGTPCQAFSVAGLRRSLEDERGNLSLVFVNLMDAIDEERKRVGKPPAICVWENVPGVLSTKDNAFGCFLAGLAGEGVPLQPSGGKWSNAGYVLGPKRAVAWRVLDAQYFGVAQRRRRVFLVASARDGFSPAAVLFEPEGLRRDHAPSRAKGQRTPGPIAGCSNGGGANGPGRTADDADSLVPIWRASVSANAEYGVDQAGTLVSHRSQLGGVVSIPGRATGWQGGSQQDQILGGDDVSPCLAHSSNAHAGHHQPKIAVPIDLQNVRCGGDVAGTLDTTRPSRGGGQAVAFTKSKRAQSTTDDESWVPGEVAPTFNCFDQGDTRATTVAVVNMGGDKGGASVRTDGSCFTLSTNEPHAVAYDVHGTLAKKGASETDVHTALRSRSPGQSEASTTTVVAFTQNTRDEVRQINGDGQIAGALSAEAGMHQTNYIAFANRTRDGIKVPEVMKDGVVPALTNPGDGGRSDAVNVVVPQAPAFTHSGYSNKPAWITGDRTDCLPSSGHGDTSHQGIGVMQPLAVRTAQTSANGHGVSEGVCHTLDQAQGQAVMTPMAVRRLTPRECHRLQGFPDDYCAITYRGKPAADGPQYKALGNSMAVPVMRWIGERIAKCAIH